MYVHTALLGHLLANKGLVLVYTHLCPPLLLDDDDVFPSLPYGVCYAATPLLLGPTNLHHDNTFSLQH